MKFSKLLDQESVPEWKKVYINYKELKHILKDVAQLHEFEKSEDLYNYNMAHKEDVKSPPLFDQFSIQDDATMDDIVPKMNKYEQKFFASLDKELLKIWEFYENNEDYAKERLKELNKAYRLLKQEHKENVIKSGSNVFKPINILNHGVDHHPSKKYEVEHDHEVRVITSEGQRKPVPMSYNAAKRRIKMGVLEFYRGVLMLKKYAQLNKTGFEKILKKFDKSYDFIVWRVGLYLGLAIALCLRGLQLALNMIKFVDTNTDEKSCSLKNSDSLTDDEQQIFYKFCDWNLLLQIYLGIFLPIMLTLLVGINVVVWSKLKINYKLVFDFDIRDNVDYREFWEFRICLPFVYGVEFRDFFIADELCSLSYTFSFLGTIVCAINNDGTSTNREQCLSDTNPWAVFIGSVPALLRFFQCLQRWVKTGKAHPHSVNALKYITTVIPFWLIYAKRLEVSLVFWYIIHVFNVIIAIFWDLVMDWALLQVWYIPNYGLREDLEYKRKWVYYFAIISNIVMRFSWIFVAFFNSKLLGGGLAFMEMMRRFQWNFFRVEKELDKSIDWVTISIKRELHPSTRAEMLSKIFQLSRSSRYSLGFDGSKPDP
ncbi:3400_t:CDS:10 [Paraglomus occultum]|uniref:3400_t:CDS:1 n=1 Tax=Paraglomus occultum TaxID=144539 RepID=A0A9N8ZQB2_9GLOM|nr:3400_t:CDS:10 [Paraglomus occultum]